MDRSSRRSSKLKPRAKATAARPRLESLESRQLLATFTVRNANDSGPDSLREAITRANGAPGRDTIDFFIDSGPFTITPQTVLPSLTDPVDMTGYTQPGATRNTLAIGNDANLVIEIDGSLLSLGNAGLTFDVGAAGSTVQGLVIKNFGVFSGNGGLQINAPGMRVAGNFIGIEADGTTPAGNGLGIRITASNVTIGGTAPGDRNLISGNQGNGVFSFNTATAVTSIVVLGNYFGTDRNGTTDVGNGNTGVNLVDTNDSTIGGTAAGARNLISGNNFDGIILSDSQRNLVQGNFIGTNVNGTAAIANGGIVGGGFGVDIFSANNTVGGTAFSARNLISGNLEGGVHLSESAANCVVLGNFIGTDVTGGAKIPNLFGVLIEAVASQSAAGNTIGGAAPGSANVISGNDAAGVSISDTSNAIRAGNVIAGNLIGTDATGTSALGNQDGVTVAATLTSNTIGGTTAAARNIISGNEANGIEIEGNQSNVAATVVVGNRIGTNSGGTAAVPNVQGIVVSSASDTTIGGAAAGAGNLISGNSAHGVFLTTSTRDVIQGNRIGTDAAGASALPNGQFGILATQASGGTIGGASASAGNLISGNLFDGIQLSGGSNNIAILRNFIGTDVTGTTDIGNQSGISLLGAGPLQPSSITIGAFTGDSGNLGNVISGNKADGISVLGGTRSAIQSNLIGVASDGNSPLPNAGNGIQFNGGDANNTVGGATTNLGNIIAFNALDGVLVGSMAPGSNGNAILTNSISRNTGKGIRLQNNGNDRQVAPVLDSATVVGVNTEVKGSIKDEPSQDYLIQFFSSPAIPPPATVQGQVFLGETTVTTDQEGLAAFTTTVGIAPIGSVITTTATRVTKNNTSEFSNSVVVAAQRSLVVLNTNDSGFGSLRDAIDFANQLPGVDTITFNIPGSPGQAFTIQPLKPLPDIDDSVIIDGYSQPGAFQNEQALGNDAKILITLDGAVSVNDNGSLVDGLVFTEGESTVRGLAINQFSGNGIRITSEGSALIVGTFIGTTNTGDSARGNGESGILIDNAGSASPFVTIGTPARADRNVISGNTLNGITATGGTPALLVQNSYIGTNAAGTAAIPNGGNGVSAVQTNVTIGDVAPGALNLISGNVGFGLDFDSTPGAAILGNFIGPDITGRVAIGNIQGGIRIIAEPTLAENVIGDPNAPNLISGNGGNGISLISDGKIRVVNNVIGTMLEGAGDLGNNGVGILVEASQVTIGGAAAADANIIAANKGAGIDVSEGATNNRISNNIIGLDAANAALGNLGPGIAIRESSAGNLIDSNTVSANNLSGVLINNSNGTVITNNRIGTTPDGLTARGNLRDGITIEGNSLGTLIGNNLIAGNTLHGVSLDGADTTRIVGNTIGLDAAGATAIPNSASGVNVANGSGNTIGGTTASDRNVISGNLADGITILRTAFGNLVQGNFIGTDAAGTTAIGNSRDGVFTEGQNNTIGGAIGVVNNPAVANLIAFNLRNGVTVEANDAGPNANGNSIIQNSIAFNAQKGIALVAGGNAFQPAPVIANAASFTGGTSIKGTLTAAPNTNYAVEFFSNDPASPNQGQTFVFQAQYTTDATGVAILDQTFSNVVPQGRFLTATATDISAENTSEFSPGVFIGLGPANLTLSIVSQPVGNVDVGQQLVYTITATNTGPSAANNVLITDTLPLGVTIVSITAPPGATVDTKGNVVSIRLGSPLDFNGIATTVITVTPDPPTAGTTITNAAEVSADETNFNPAAAKANVSNPVISTSKITATVVANPDPVFVAQDLTYTITMTIPTGGSRNVVLQDTLPNFATFVSTSDGAFDPATGRVNANLGDLPAGQRVVTIVVRPTNAGTLTNTAFITDAAQSNLTITTHTESKFSFTVLNTHDSGFGSLRQAILNSNAHGEIIDTIDFNIPGVGPFLIQPKTPYSDLRDTVVIDATTQPGFAGVPIVVVNGAALPPINPSNDQAIDQIIRQRSGLVVRSSHSQILGLRTERFEGYGVVLTSSLDVGPTRGGFLANNQFVDNGFGGVLIDNAGQNTVGGTSFAAGNLISGNEGVGVRIERGSAGNVVRFNFIGTNVDGGTARGNGLDGVLILDSPANTIGAITAGAANVIAGSGEVDVQIFGPASTRNVVVGNSIGVDRDGNSVLGSPQVGVLINNAPANTVGGMATGATNVIGGAFVGVQIFGPQATGNAAFQNLIGVGNNGRAVPNSYGILIDSAPMNTVGATAAGGANVISGNRILGVRINGAQASNNALVGNLIGLGVGGNPMPNARNGVWISNAPSNLLASNVISSNGDVGVQIQGASARGNTLSSNLIGTDPTGQLPRGNGQDGVLINGAPGNTIGPNNIISANVEVGVFVFAPDAAGNTITGNLIGTNTTPDLGNGFGVVLRGSPGTTLSNNQIVGNRVGQVLDQSGQAAPIVASVSVRRAGGAGAASAIVLRFNRRLAKSLAENVNNYRLIGAGGRAIAIQRAVYNDALRTVTLTPVRPVKTARSATLTVKARRPRGLADARRVLLDGNLDGKAGGDFRISIGPRASTMAQRTAAIDAVLRRGAHAKKHLN